MRKLLPLILSLSLAIPLYAQDTQKRSSSHRKRVPAGVSSGSSTLLDGLYVWYDLESDCTDSHTGPDLTASPTPTHSTGSNGNGVDFSHSGNDTYRTATAWHDLGDADWTFAFWINVHGSITTFQRYFEEGYYTSWTCGVIVAGTTYRYYVQTDAATAVAISTVTVAADEWHCVVVWHDATNDEIGISVDDETPVTATTSGNIPRTTNNDMNLGGNTLSVRDVKFDSFAKWTRVLTSAEITEFNNSGSALAYNEL